MTSKMYNHYGMYAEADDVYFTHLGRNFAIRWACTVGLEECQSDASEIMAKHFHERHVLDRNYEDIISCAGFHTMNITDYNVVMAQIDGTGNGVATRPEAIRMILCTYNPEFIWDLLDKIVDEDPLWTEAERLQVLTTLIQRDIQGLEIVLEFLKNNSEKLKALITSDHIATVFQTAAAASYSRKLATTIKELARTYENHLGNELISTLEVRLDSNLAWMTETGDLVVEFLTSDHEEPDGGDGNTLFVSGFLIFAALLASLLRA